ncbi:AlbA family DNA-binding domain-containing protein [Flammeovirga agarivorans]|uniref:ATP-binding protein n=1 Tax=Flammeovirga agarivorans TaxID=2726742 RepID=A0A7X8XV54_9BACT|nr:ATP-binding protein [Flammeovirga agarivorans]NLR91037.1 ATP-binding protein [Flammeovirga agarivorans]
MDLKFLKQLVNQGEGFKIEFKKKAADPLKIMKEVVAFANKYGGYLIVGVADDGRIDGFTDVDGELFVLEKAIKSRLSVKIDYTVYKVQVSAMRQVLVIEIPPSTKQPVFLLYNLKRRIGKPYIRVEDKSVQMSKVIRRLLKERSKSEEHVVSFGEIERKVLQLIDQKGYVTVDELVKLDMDESEVVEAIIHMCLANILQEVPREVNDRFIIHPSSKLAWNT